MDWYRKIPLFLLTLSISFSHASVCYGVKQNRLDASLYFYPVPFQASKSYPNLFFQVGSNIHVRDALTGEIKQILKLDEGERIADCDRDSALLYCPKQSNDDQVAYKRIDLDGTNESFIFKKIIIAGQKRNTQNISFINNKPYFFYETGDPVNKNYQFTVQSADSILWTETNGENETWNFNGCFSYKDKQIVAISVMVCQKEFFLKFFNLVTGKPINTLEGCFERIIPPNYNSPIIALNKCTTK